MSAGECVVDAVGDGEVFGLHGVEELCGEGGAAQGG